MFHRVMNIVTKNVTRILEEKKWTQIQLAKLAGLNEGGLSRLLKSTSNPTLSSIQKLARALDIEPYKLLVEYSPNSLGPISNEEKVFITELRNVRSEHDRKVVLSVIKSLSNKAAR